MPPRPSLEFAFCRFEPLALVKGMDSAAGLAERYPGMALIRGIATTQHRDLDNEVVHTDGLSWATPCYLTIEHPRTHLNIIGEVLQKSRVEVDGEPAIEVIGGIYRHVPAGMKVYDHAHGIMKSGGTCPFGFSVEGPSEGLERSRGHIHKATVTSVAVTMGPRNTRATWAPLMKGLFDADPLAASLVAEFGLTPTDLIAAALLKGSPKRTWEAACAAASRR